MLGADGAGHDVVQQDLERGLCPFRDGQFDWVVLSQTLQSVTETELIVREMVRVGRLQPAQRQADTMDRQMCRRHADPLS